MTTDDLLLVVILRGSDRYIFQFLASEYSAAISQAGRWASDADLSFTWYDAALASQAIRQRCERSSSCNGI